MAPSRPQSRHSDLTDDDDHFSDATEGRSIASGHTSPVPRLTIDQGEPKALKGHVGRKLSTSLPGSFDDEDTIEPDAQDETELSPSSEASERTVPATLVTQVEDDIPVPPQPIESFALSPSDQIPHSRKSSLAHSRRSSRAETTRAVSPISVRRLSANAEDDGFGDFDDFGDGAEGDDFGDFGEEFAIEDDEPAPIPEPSFHYKNLDSRDSVVTAVEAYLAEHFPVEQDNSRVDPLSKESSVFLSERSRSLWSQLVAPPPLQPPNWLRSRIRRLFLVSLGVPVDLDEILPASKQKKLVLPSTGLTRSPSSDTLQHSALDRLKDENASQTSVTSTDSKGTKKSRRKKDALPPALDVSTAKQLCATTDAALQGLDDNELRKHVLELEKLKERAAEVLQHWEKKNEGALGDKEAFEGVIENLVKHARKVRK